MVIEDGVVYFNFTESNLEFHLFRQFEDLLAENGYQYLTLPTTVEKTTLIRQGIKNWAYTLEPYRASNGETGQTFFNYFEKCEMKEPLKVFSRTICFNTSTMLDEHHQREFSKIEQCIFTNEANWLYDFEELMGILFQFVTNIIGIDRCRTASYNNPATWVFKKKIEVLTKDGEWLNVASCTYFADRKSKKLGITGEYNHIITSTGLAPIRLIQAINSSTYDSDDDRIPAHKRLTRIIQKLKL